MRELLGLWLLLAGTFLGARIVTSFGVSGQLPQTSVIALHLAVIPLAQAAVLMLVARRAKRSD